MNTHEKYKTKVWNLRQAHKRAADRHAEAFTELTQATATRQVTIEAQRVAQEVAAQVQRIAHDKIAKIVSKCLAVVFEDPYEFTIDFEQKRGKTEAVLSFWRKGHRVDPTGAAGGGVKDVAAFALRLACLMFETPPKNRLLIMDEPFKALSHGYPAKAAMMLEALSHEMGVQFVLVTHIDELKTGNIIEVV